MRRLLLLFFFGLPVVLLGILLWPSPSVRTRDLGCTAQIGAQADRICRALEENLEWTWTGHAIIAPGWRVTFATAKRVYCQLGLTQADLPALAALDSLEKDWRLQNGAKFLTRLLTPEGETDTVFDPHSPSYILKEPCAP